MAASTTIRTPIRRVDLRKFHLREHTAWVSRLVTSNGQTLGIRLTIVFGPFGISPGEYFTDDEGRSFRCVSLYIGGMAAELVVESEFEQDAEKISVAREGLAVWQKASGHSARRAVVRDTCVGLLELLKSLTDTPVHAHLQGVGNILAASQSTPDNRFQQVEEDLAALLRTLKATDAADGEKIISPTRFERFLQIPSDQDA